MKRLLIILTLALLAAPAFAQAETPKEEKPKAEEKKEAKAEEVKISDDGQKLFEDVERVLKKYYEIKLDNLKQNKQVNLDDDWNAAVKEAKNATYKDFKEFDAAIKAMQKSDKVFARQFTDTSNKLAKEYSEAVRKWIDDQKGK